MRAIADAPEGPSSRTFASRLAHIVLWAGDLRLHPHDGSRDAMSWWDERGEEVARRLRDRGWSLGEREHLDVAVIVDAEHRVRCATDQPARRD